MNTVKLCIIIGCAIMLSFVSTIHGGECLHDGDTSHTAADWNQRLWSYSSSQPIQPSTSSDLRFMTFNLQSGFGTVNGNCVNNVTAQALLVQANADYVGTQETVQGVDTRCGCLIPKIFADVAGMSTRFVMAMPYRTGQYGDSVGTSQTILETQWGQMAYPNYEVRTVQAIRTQPYALRGRNLWYVNVHVEFFSNSVRVSQVNDVLNFIKRITSQDPNAVVVMGGDFNGGPWDPPYNTIKAAGFKNTWEVFNKNNIEGGNTIPADWPGSRFDHIWYYAPTDVSVTVKNVVIHDVRLSDHRPMTATLNFAVAGSAGTNSPDAAVTPAPPPVQATTKPSQVVCVTGVWEGSSFSLTCPSPSQTVTSVQFASYGTPVGTCGNFNLGWCIGGSSMAVMLDKCHGKNSCSFTIGNSVFGDPCPGTGKMFSTQVTCS